MTVRLPESAILGVRPFTLKGRRPSVRIGWATGSVLDPSRSDLLSKKHSKDKVDGPVAMANALGGYLQDKPKQASVYSRLSVDDLMGAGDEDDE